VGRGGQINLRDDRFAGRAGAWAITAPAGVDQQCRIVVGCGDENAILHRAGPQQRDRHLFTGHEHDRGAIQCHRPDGREHPHVFRRHAAEGAEALHHQTLDMRVRHHHHAQRPPVDLQLIGGSGLLHAGCDDLHAVIGQPVEHARCSGFTRLGIP
jgi:hypothetical protein